MRCPGLVCLGRAFAKPTTALLPLRRASGRRGKQSSELSRWIRIWQRPTRKSAESRCLSIGIGPERVLPYSALSPSTREIQQWWVLPPARQHASAVLRKLWYWLAGRSYWIRSTHLSADRWRNSILSWAASRKQKWASRRHLNSIPIFLVTMNSLALYIWRRDGLRKL